MWQFPLLAASSFGLGALHALEPGHGKTVVGAYLIGSKGRVSDAVVLGLIVTLTHAGSVILLGVLSTLAAAIFVPETVQKVLEVVSGLLVVGMGGWMLAVRVRQARGTALEHADRSHDAEHEHTHGSADHAHEHDSTHERARPYEQAHGQGRRVHSHVPAPAPGEKPSMGQLLALGVSGGIVPCPAALAVLLAAVSYGQFVRGLSLVVIFSIGMAAVLVAIGIMMLKAADFAGAYLAQGKWTKVVPIFSAALIMLVGVGLSAKAVLDLFPS